MKIGLIVLTIMLFFTGCQNNPIIIEDNDLDEVQTKSFEERTSEYFTLKSSMEDDRLRQDFANIRLFKVDDSHYELKADLIGDAKIDLDVMDNAIKKIKDENLEKLEIQATNGKKLIIYSSRPQAIKAMYENVKEDYNLSDEEFELYGLPVFEDNDWISAKDDNDWLTEDGIPMYVEYNGNESWPLIKKEDDGYYLYGRNGAGRTMDWTLTTVNQKDALVLNLVKDDKIIIEPYYFYGLAESDTPIPNKEMTVEEYYNIGNTVTDEGYIINKDNMSEANYYSAGLKIEDGAIKVVGYNDGP